MSKSFDEPYIYNYMDLSTGHLTKDDAAALDRDAEYCKLGNPTDCMLIVFKYDEGWFVSVPPDDEGNGEDLALSEEVLSTYSEQMVRILKKARYNDCCFVRFDADGLRYEDLERFTW